MLKLIAFITFAATTAQATWSLSYRVVATLAAGVTIVCAVAGPLNCMISALSGAFFAVGSAINGGERTGTESMAKRELVSFAQKVGHNGTHFGNGSIPNNLSEDTVYSRLECGHWYGNVHVSLLNDTVMEQISHFGNTFMYRGNGMVKVSNVHPEVKALKRAEMVTGDLQKRTSLQQFSDFVVTFREDSNIMDTITSSDAQDLAKDIIHSDPKPDKWCATLTSSKDSSKVDFGITIDSTSLIQSDDEPPCSA